MRARSAPLLVVLALLSAEVARAWTHSPLTNLPVSTAVLNQGVPQMVLEGSGGAIVVWRDARGGVGTEDIYAHRVLGSGALDPAWPAGGLLVCGAANIQEQPQVITDGLGGAIVTWMDFRNGSEWKLHSRRVLASGVNDPAWPANGRAISAAAGNQMWPVVVPDGSGGMILAWEDYRSGNADIYAMHVAGNGVLDTNWPVDGLPVVALAGAQTAPAIVSDYATGAIVTWVDARVSSFTDIYVQHLQPPGVVDPAWPANGRLVLDAAFPLFAPQITTDGANGAIVGFSAAGGPATAASAQHVQSTGVLDPAWPATGRQFTVASTSGSTLSSLVPDWTGGAIAVLSEPTSPTNYDITAHHVLASGALDPQYPATGRALCRAVGNQMESRSLFDGAGGAWVVWKDGRGGGTNDIYAHHLLAEGIADPAWPVDGRAVCTAIGDQSTPTMVPDLAGGLVIGWADNRNGNLDIFAQNITTFGVLGDPEPAIVSIADLPNDQGGHVRIRWNASQMDVAPHYEIGSYGIWREVTESAATQALERGARLAGAEFKGTVERGVYRAIGTNALTTWWEGVGMVSARGEPWYTFVAATFSDSGAAGNPLTAFFVEARAGLQIGWWDSAPVSGYSVDNLPPAAPAPFTGQYMAGTALLHWNPNVENDLAGYRMYRGTTTSFVPGPGNLIAALGDTGYSDPAGAPYVYKLTAVDANGNESPVAMLAFSGSAGVEDGVPREVSFAAPMPNPATAFCRFRFALPHASNVRLAVYDVKGRLVREIATGIRPAGEHGEPWDLRDRDGRSVSAGLYFGRLEVGGKVVLTHRIAITR